MPHSIFLYSRASAGSSSLVPLNSSESDGTANALSVTGIDYSTYKQYVLRIIDFKQSTSSSASVLVELLDGAGTPLSTDYRGCTAWMRYNNTAWSVGNISGSGFTPAFKCYANAASRPGVNGECIMSLIAGVWPTCTSHCSYVDPGTAYGGETIYGGQEHDTTTVAEIRIRSTNNDTLLSGSKIALYGVR